MIYWNQQENPNLDFDRWDYSGIGDNTEEAFSFKIKKCKPGNENEFIATQPGSRNLSLGYRYYFIIGNDNGYPRIMTYGHSENAVYRDNLLGIT
jgi:hypothetical protein